MKSKTKKCVVCGNVFSRKTNLSDTHWKAKKYCSWRCRNRSNKQALHQKQAQAYERGYKDGQNATKIKTIAQERGVALDTVFERTDYTGDTEESISNLAEAVRELELKQNEIIKYLNKEL